ncbi:MAG TPA: cohesin domain-containing protein [Acidobacteriaceae bacterium]|jgi:general secretion pathway protein D|nr:cohesin domain-containing protein [Acidobacteriaceae bacterium]
MTRGKIGWRGGTPAARWRRVGAGLALVVMCGLVVSSAAAQSAGKWNKRGEDAEAREDYDAAYEAYRQAWLKKPHDMRYKERYERLRFEDANQHVDRGRVLRQSGDVDGAINEFARALQIDPGNQAAAQELEITQRPPAGAARGAAPAGPNSQALSNAGPGASALIPGVDEETPHQRRVQQDIDSLGGPVQLQPVSTDPITLHMVEDTKIIYQAIGKAAGLNVIFDPDYTSKRIPVDLTNVSLYDALRIVGTLSDTFWKPVTPNTIFVAQNNRQKRTDLGDQAVQTFYLTNVSQQNDANEILIALRNLLSTDIKVYLVASQNAIVLRASPAELILAEKIINDLDRTRPEVVVDVAVLEVSRQKERDLGITLPTSFGLTPQYSNQNVNSTTTTTGTTTTGTGTTGTGTSTSSLTLNTLGNLNATNFAVSVTGGQVNALLTDSDTRILQNPRIRATDGQHATLKIGSKYPVATGSYNAGVSTGLASLGVQTQFQYLDVGVNIDITPTVHYDREISLKMKIEISSTNGNVDLEGGVTEPIISQRVAEQTIQLKDGEPSLLAGILTNQDTKTVNGTPGLGELPILKYFFSSQDKVQQSDEIVFLVIPHIVRESILTDENTRPIYTGTSQAVELIRNEPGTAHAEPAVLPERSGVGATSTTTAANAASAMLPQIAAAGHPISPPSATGAFESPTSAAATSAGGTPLKLTVVTPSDETVGSTFQVAVQASNAHDLFGVPLQMQFDPHVLALVDVDSGDLLGRDGQAVALVHRDEGDGAVTISATRPPNTRGVEGQGTLVTLTFRAVAPGNSQLALVRIGARDSHQNSIPATGTAASVRVTGASTPPKP